MNRTMIEIPIFQQGEHFKMFKTEHGMMHAIHCTDPTYFSYCSLSMSKIALSISSMKSMGPTQPAGKNPNDLLFTPPKDYVVRTEVLGKFKLETGDFGHGVCVYHDLSSLHYSATIFFILLN